MQDSKREIINQLRKEILLLEGFKSLSGDSKTLFGLPPIEAAFPNGVIPIGAIHEFLTGTPEHEAASNGFISGLLNTLMGNSGVCLWISTSRKLFPPAIKAFGVEPDRVIFIDLKREKEALWATEEALKCNGLAAVVADLREISFTQSRRLQLVVEESKVTGIILRNDLQKLNTTAFTARWKVSSLPSVLEADMPGIGFPRWNIELLRVRNGSPGIWQVEWSAGCFHMIGTNSFSEHKIDHLHTLNTG